VKRAAARGVLLCALMVSAGSAQEMLSMPSATAPSPGVLIPRVQLRGSVFEGGQGLVEQRVRAEYGLVRDWSASLELPINQGFFDGPRPSGGAVGLGSLEALVEWRVVRWDLGPIDTVRGTVFGGADLPTGTGGFGESGLQPCVGGVVTTILGRQGFDVAARYTWATAGAARHPHTLSQNGRDRLEADVGYAFRLAPATYGEVREAAWYGTLELNSAFSADDAHLVTVGPGLLIEAPTYALELGVQLPASSAEDHAPRLRYGVILGVRWFL
jgi:hypothetical protein